MHQQCITATLTCKPESVRLCSTDSRNSCHRYRRHQCHHQRTLKACCSALRRYDSHSESTNFPLVCLAVLWVGVDTHGLCLWHQLQELPIDGYIENRRCLFPKLGIGRWWHIKHVPAADVFSHVFDARSHACNVQDRTCAPSEREKAVWQCYCLAMRQITQQQLVTLWDWANSFLYALTCVLV